MEKNILDSILDFFKSIGHKKPSGEPINSNWNSGADKKLPQDGTNLAQEETSNRALQGIDKEPHIDLLVDVENDSDAPEAMVLEPSEAHESKVELPQQLVQLQSHYSWRALKAKDTLPQQILPDPFYFISKDKQPVVANRAEVSFIKELLKRAAETGVENKFQFSLSKTHEVVVKYRYKLLGRVFLQGRKHRMVFKVDGNTYILENLSLAECKKLLVIWIGQIKIPVKVIDLMDKVPVTGNGYSIKFLGKLGGHKVYLQDPKEWQGCVGLPTFVLLDKYGEARYATPDETMQCMRM